MKAILREVSEAELARRRLLGLDRWDEMWEGVLHMAPAPAYRHQRIQTLLAAFLAPLLERRDRGTLVLGVNVFNDRSPSPDYRIPDFIFVGRGNEHLVREDGIHGEGLDAVLEIRSPGDETYEKLSFYAGVGVREVLVLDRDTRKPEVYRLAGPQYLAVSRDPEGWVTSEALRIRLRLLGGEAPRARVEDLDDPESCVEI